MTFEGSKDIANLISPLSSINLDYEIKVVKIEITRIGKIFKIQMGNDICQI